MIKFTKKNTKALCRNVREFGGGNETFHVTKKTNITKMSIPLKTNL